MRVISASRRTTERADRRKILLATKSQHARRRAELERRNLKHAKLQLKKAKVACKLARKAMHKAERKSAKRDRELTAFLRTVRRRKA